MCVCTRLSTYLLVISFLPFPISLSFIICQPIFQIQSHGNRASKDVRDTSGQVRKRNPVNAIPQEYYATCAQPPLGTRQSAAW